MEDGWVERQFAKERAIRAAIPQDLLHAIGGMMHVGEFHHTNGWYFKRLDDGSVQIRHEDATQVIEPDGWASIVAHVADGGTSQSFTQAKALHAIASVPPAASEPTEGAKSHD